MQPSDLITILSTWAKAWVTQTGTLAFMSVGTYSILSQGGLPILESATVDKCTQ